MRRFLAIFLLVFLPFQFSWAAVAGYCQHETEGPAQHFGHHEHKHQAEQADQADFVADANDTAPDTRLPGSIDNDCGACHAGCCAAALLGDDSLLSPGIASLVIPWLKSQLASPPNTQPERPNWSVLA